MSDSNSLSIVAFGAHPDDIEFGCGGIIAREVQQGAKAHFVVCSRGESASNGTPDERASEAEAGARFLGATLEFLDLGGDAHIERSIHHVCAFAAIIRQRRPAVVLAPTPIANQHPDHHIVGQMVRDAARLARYAGVAELKGIPPHAVDQLLFFAVTADAEFTGSSAALIDVSPAPVMAAWTSAMEAHASQMATRNYVELQLARARLHGLQAGVGHAIAVWPNDTLVFDSLRQLGRSARRF